MLEPFHLEMKERGRNSTLLPCPVSSYTRPRAQRALKVMYAYL